MLYWFCASYTTWGMINTMREIDYLLQIESKYNLPEISLNGFAYWIYFRRNIMWELIRKKNHYGEAHRQADVSKKYKIKLRIGMIKNALFCHRADLKDADALILNHERRVWNGQYYECIYTDMLADRLGRAVTLERPYQQQHFAPTPTPCLIYTDWIEVKASLFLYMHKYVFKKEYRRVMEHISNNIKTACDELAGLLQISCDVQQFAAMIADGYFVYQVKKKNLDCVLDRFNPKVIIEVVSYNMDCMIVNELASRRGIPTIELQHGIADQEHLAYNYTQGVSVRQFPKYFFAFSDFWCHEARFPIAMQNRKAIGFPHLETRAEEFRNFPKDEKRIILFISQGPIGKELSEIAVALNELIDLRIYRIIYKLHPGEYEEWDKKYERLAASGIEVVDNNKTDLYQLFAVSSCQVGGYGSTATLEGMYFELPAYIYENRASGWLLSLCRQKMAWKFRNAGELWELIRSNEDKSDVSQKFWKSHALENMVSEIANIMNESECGSSC